jgi:hypothetical protein
MGRIILGIIAGLVAWALIATLLDHGLRYLLPGYTAAEPTLAFTLPMEIGRLTLAVLTSLSTGAIIRAIAPASRWAPWVVGILLLALFLPVHLRIGARLPLWYHLFFLVTLAPLVVLGAQWWRLGRPRPAPETPTPPR